MEETGFTLEGRVLCADDACIGTVGPDRRCKVCGKIYDGDESLEATGDRADDGRASGAPEPADAAAAADRSFDPDERECCSDESCIGVIGPDGTCGTCGKPR